MRAGCSKMSSIVFVNKLRGRDRKEVFFNRLKNTVVRTKDEILCQLRTRHEETNENVDFSKFQSRSFN